MEKNEEYIVEIVGYTSDGQGVARENGFVIFVPFAVLGEKVKVHIIKVNKSFAVGKIVEILTPSKSRIEPPCPYFKKCGGCDFQHISYLKTLEIKKQIVSETLAKIGGFQNINVKNPIKSDKFYNYRNKSAYPIVFENGMSHVAMFKILSHDAVEISSCLLAEKSINLCASVFNDYMKTLKDEQKKSLRFLVVRSLAGGTLVTVVGDKFFDISPLYSLLCESLHESKVGLFFSKKDIDNNVILEGDIRHIAGIKQIDANFMGIDVSLSPLSFFQINEEVFRQLYEKVAEQFSSEEIVVDAYSGAGLMSALIAKKVKKVYAIEIIKDATKDANKLKEKNGISNLVNINGDAKDELKKLVREIGSEFSLVLDPPRKGVHKDVIDCVLKTKPKKIVYVSCSVSSLARDLKLLSEGYEIDEIQPFDMFPQTHHVECVAILHKK